MSKKHDARNQIRLTPDNYKALLELQKAMALPTKLTTLANFILTKHGIPEFRESDLLRDAMKK